jgi:hypothetical protein
MADEIEIVDESSEQESAPAVTEPGKLMRIAVMLRELQEEVRRAEPDNAGRDRLKLVHEKALGELCDVLSGDLQTELRELTLPFEEGTPTGSEIRIAQAQLVGWLEGLFQGIQAAVFTQQAQARAQFEQMRSRGLPAGASGAPGAAEAMTDGPPTSTGQYL